MAGEPELQKGQSGEWVQYLQQCLAQYGYWNGGTDGEFGDQLEQAVQQFQAACGQSADGIVRQATWDSLTGAGSQSGGNSSGRDGSGGGGSGTSGEQADGVYIELSEIPAIYELSQYDASDSGAEHYLAALGVEKPTEGDQAYA